MKTLPVSFAQTCPNGQRRPGRQISLLRHLTLDRAPICPSVKQPRSHAIRPHASLTQDGPSRSVPSLLDITEDGPSTSSSNPPGTGEIEDVQMPRGVDEHYWKWTVPESNNLETRIRYFQAGTSGPPILLLHGFGVGAYHYERNITALSKTCQVFAVDILGQGSSWPVRPVTPEDCLYVSIDTWRMQLRDFANEIMHVSASNPTYVAGNSLGGLLAVYLATFNPELVRGLVLLNATPFWSIRPALQAASQGFWGLFPPGFGSVPVPARLKHFIEAAWWNNLRSPGTIRNLLRLVYCNGQSVDEDTIERILEATRQPLALDVFSAIALAPKPELGFDQCLDQLQVPVLMLYGREDPWVVPLWGQRLKKRVPKAIYLEMSPAGHCPHHEVPATVNWAIVSWITSGHQAPVPEGGVMQVEEEPGRMITVRHLGGNQHAGPTNFLSKFISFLEKHLGKRREVPG